MPEFHCGRFRTKESRLSYISLAIQADRCYVLDTKASGRSNDTTMFSDMNMSDRPKRRTAETILKLRGQKRTPEQIACMQAAQAERRADERAKLPEGERFLFRHSIERRLEIRSYRHSPETIERMKAAQAKRRTAEQEIKNLGVL